MPKIFVRLSVLFHFFHSFLLLLLPMKPFQTHEIKPTQIKNKNTKKNKFESDLPRIFDTFDADKDGLITRHELSTSLHKMGISITDADLSDLIAAADANSDGCVDADEFEALYSLLISSADKEEEEDNMKGAFGVFDKDGDGFISEEELKGVLESLGICHGRSLDECRKMIQRVDVDGDGRVCFSEFRNMMKDVGRGGPMCGPVKSRAPSDFFFFKYIKRRFDGQMDKKLNSEDLGMDLEWI